MSDPLRASYEECQRITRQATTNFYYSFYALPRVKRQAMYALYAFLRLTDDLGDDDRPRVDRRAALALWREELDRALLGEPRGAVFPAVVDTATRFDIPGDYLRAVIDGVAMDLDGRRYETWDELAEYCHHVASVVGLACIHIWGFRDPAALEPARKCGLAFQLTNILRDLKDDAAAGRVYLPREDFCRFGYSPEELQRGVSDDRLRALVRFEIARAEQLYREAAELERYLDADGQAVLGAMVHIYHGLLDKLRRLDGDVLGRRVRLSTWHKMSIACQWCLPRPAWAWRPSLLAADRR